MENPEIGVGEKIYCHSYDRLIREMAKTMEIDETKIFPQKEGEFNHEDIQSWIGAVDFKNGKTPDIEVNLSADQGKEVFKFDIRDQKTVEGRDEKATKEELIYSMALTEAKMKVVAETAEEIYPAVSFQIEDYRREMEKVREEILGNKKEAMSLEEILGGVINRKSLATAIILGGYILTACGGGEVNASSGRGTVITAQPTISEVVEAPMPKVTQEPVQSEIFDKVPIVEEKPETEIKTVKESKDSDEEYEAIAIKAAIEAVKSFNRTPYSWKTNSHCSSFASRYIDKLGLPVSLPKDYASDPVEFPYASTLFQVNWLEKHYQGTEFLSKVTVDDLLDGKLWDSIKPGSVIYLQTMSNHNGYNTYDHVVVYLGLDEKGEPSFAEFVPAMKLGPETGRSLEEVAKMYKPLGEGKWDLRTFDEKKKDRPQPEHLYATVFDAVGAYEASLNGRAEIPK